MCEPTTIMAVSSVVLTVASTAYAGYTQYENQKAGAEASKMQNEIMQKNWMSEAAAAREAALANIQQLDVAQTQAAAESREEMTDAAREAQAAKAKMMVASGESGVSGNLVSALRGTLDLTGAEDMATLEANAHAKQQQLQYEKEQARRRGTTVGTGPQNIIIEPNPWNAVIGTGLQIGGEIAGSGLFQKPKPKPGPVEYKTGR